MPWPSLFEMENIQIVPNLCVQPFVTLLISIRDLDSFLGDSCRDFELRILLNPVTDERNDAHSFKPANISHNSISCDDERRIYFLHC